ncbi:aspartate aminotransferase [Plectosphaerella plurivora]|uniref:Aspartate aminotransferase n=1 Tax=Plectosphaerella plurivora TaxID=936078 RepID=A0A9P8V8S5_9PEZI|nr:aspartate aminotransferase [Plectosphaerella plurivora]
MPASSPHKSLFGAAKAIPPDSIFEVTKRYLADDSPEKINLGQGTYRDENGQPWVLPSVKLAKEALGETGHEYLPIAGLKELRDETVRLVFEKTSAYKEQRIASCQAISGTGSLLLVGLTIRRVSPATMIVYITDPTWSNHELLFASQGYEVRKLPYTKADGSFDFDTYISAIRAADPFSAVILHACAHNPTGYDPSHEQWKMIATAMIERSLFPVFDSAYLGFKSGSVDDDAWAIRYFVDDLGLEAAVCFSFAKNMGLYGERVGLVAFVTSSPELARTAGSILENVQRSTVSNPPAYGARIAAKVLGTEEIRAQWARDLITMSGRVRSMRENLYEELVRLKTPGDWSHVVQQGGMFGFLGIKRAQVQFLEDQRHVYMAETSRISIAGLNEGNVKRFAQALDEAVRTIA